MTSAIGRTERRAEFFCLRVTHPCLNEKVGCGPERACQMVQNELRPTRTWKAVTSTTPRQLYASRKFIKCIDE